MGNCIIDKIANCDKYVGLNSRFAKAFEFLKRADLRDLAIGKYDIIPGECWAMVQNAELKPFAEAKVEAHRKYIDIQVPLVVDEIIGVATLGDAELALPFDETKDCSFYDIKSEPKVVHLGEFALLFPPDCGHAPCCCAVGRPMQKKIVIKVLAAK